MGIPLNIDWQQILLHAFNFVILMGGLYFILYKPVKDFMDKRSSQYKDMDDEANAKLKAADDVKAEYDEKLKMADEEIRQKKKDAFEKADADADAMRAKANAEAQKMIKDAKADIEREHQKMLDDSKKEIANLAIEATKKLLAQSANDPYETFLQNVDGGGADERA